MPYLTSAKIFDQCENIFVFHQCENIFVFHQCENIFVFHQCENTEDALFEKVIVPHKRAPCPAKEPYTKLFCEKEVILCKRALHTMCLCFTTHVCVYVHLYTYIYIYTHTYIPADP